MFTRFIKILFPSRPFKSNLVFIFINTCSRFEKFENNFVIIVLVIINILNQTYCHRSDCRIITLEAVLFGLPVNYRKVMLWLSQINNIEYCWAGSIASQQNLVGVVGFRVRWCYFCWPRLEGMVKYPPPPRLKCGRSGCFETISAGFTHKQNKHPNIDLVNKLWVLW